MSGRRKILIIVMICLVLILAVCIFASLRSGEGQPAATVPQETTQLASEETETTNTAVPETTQATVPETTQATEPEPTKATEPEPTNATEPEPTKATEPEETQRPTVPADEGNKETLPEEEIVQPDTDPSDPPPVVEIPDPEPEKVGLQFPCEVPGHNLKIEKLAPYSGLFVENGSNTQVTDVAMILIRNTGKDAVEYTQITVKFAEKTLEFHITALPAGESMVVQEMNCQSIPEGEPLEATALVIHRAQMAIAPEVSVKDNGDNTLTVTNLTEQTIPMVRVFYKYYMEKENLFVGGIAFTLKITNLPAKGNMVVQPAHFVSDNSRVVMALIYDSIA